MVPSFPWSWSPWKFAICRRSVVLCILWRPFPESSHWDWCFPKWTAKIQKTLRNEIFNCGKKPQRMQCLEKFLCGMLFQEAKLMNWVFLKLVIDCKGLEN
mmetsp:Transcript_88261/g.254698  ORF Transcript_88261/g.254698 Transcript_88261/m.254698 type:complete len:100 (+) Transcript_88261:110-409(+)